SRRVVDASQRRTNPPPLKHKLLSARVSLPPKLLRLRGNLDVPPPWCDTTEPEPQCRRGMAMANRRDNSIAALLTARRGREACWGDGTGSFRRIIPRRPWRRRRPISTPCAPP